MRTPEWAKDVCGYAQGMMESHSLPGLALAVAQHGATVYEAGFGYRDRERRLPVTADTIFGIASSTKSFTCLAVLQLEEAGKLSVDDPVVRYLPEFRTPDRAATPRITLHHFMTHSSGLPPLPSRFFVFARSFADDPGAERRPVWVSDHEPIESYEALMAFIAEHDFALLGSPGDQFSYSNEGFALLGAIIARVSGQSFEQFVQDRILDPAGMTHSMFDVKALENHSDVTTLYAVREENDGRDIYEAPVWVDAPIWSAAGRLKSNTRDLLRYLELYRTGGMVGTERLLSAANVDRMLTPYIQAGNPNMYYGYGLMIRPDYHSACVAEHGGGRKGISAHVCVARDIGFTGVGLANVQNVPVASVVHAALNATLGMPVDTPTESYPDYKCPPDRLNQYSGEYRSDEGTQIVVSVEHGSLVLAMGNQQERRTARPVGEHAFVLQHDRGDAYIRFLVDDTLAAHAVVSGVRIVNRVPGEIVNRES